MKFFDGGYTWRSIRLWPWRRWLTFSFEVARKPRPDCSIAYKDAPESWK